MCGHVTLHSLSHSQACLQPFLPRPIIGNVGVILGGLPQFGVHVEIDRHTAGSTEMVVVTTLGKIMRDLKSCASGPDVAREYYARAY